MAVNQPRLEHTIVPRVMTPHEAATALRVSRPTIYRLVAAGELRHVKLGAAIRIPSSEVERLLAFAGDGEVHS